MELLKYSPQQLTVYTYLNNPPPNTFRDKLVKKYHEPISKLAPSQQKHIYKIAKLAYYAGVQDTKNKYKIKKSVEYEDDSDED